MIDELAVGVNNQGTIKLEETHLKPIIRVKLLNHCSHNDLTAFLPILNIINETFNAVQSKDENYDLVINGLFGNKPKCYQNVFCRRTYKRAS